MTGVRLEVQWSPMHPNMFITWGTEIFLYETLPRKEVLKSSYVPISDTTVAHLLATNSNHHYVKCVDIYPQPEPDILLAIGQANGKVVLTTFGPTTFDSSGLTGLELTPKHARQCNTVAWNPVDSNLIAAGLDKYRTDHSVLLWDVLKCPMSRSHGSSTPVDHARPVAELGLSDTAHSLAWLSQPQSLVIGMNNKHIKMVDLRDSSKAANSAPTKAVYGITVAPHSEHQLASFYENQIAIWDTRTFEKPVLTLPQAKQVSKILWCPTRHNLLGSLQRDSSVIHLHDVQQSMDDTEPSVLERSVQPGAANQITSFAWHPTHENRLLSIALSGTLTDYVVFERMTLNWSSSSHIVWTFGRRTLKMISDKDSVYSNINDISTTMKQRAMQGYGLKNDLWQNGELVDDVSLKNLWQWFYLSKNLVEDGHIDVNGSNKHPGDPWIPGVRSVLGMDSGSSIACKSDLVCLPWTDFTSSQSTARVYRSDDRDIALQLCGWRFEKDSSALNSFLGRLEAENEYPRAAAIAVFNLRLRTAIEILNRGAMNEKNSSNLNIVAMALSGYTDSKNSMWREMCLTAKAQISHPYLRATFGFLTEDNYDAVLNETGITVQDRVAFACNFLSNSKLQEYLSQLTETLVQDGDLAGMLLTGACSEGIPLLQRYLDITGDVQSVSMIAIQTFPPDLLDKDPTIQEWINSYRVLLDGWRLWTQRAHVDIALSAHNTNAKPVQQVYVSCNFCGKSISVYMQRVTRNRSQLARLGTMANKLNMSSCPNCRKPQPRCAICLVNMGTPSCYQGLSGVGSPTRPSTIKLTEFASWFTWCQTCRHGGHSSHMTQWFREHSECPVTACTCRCLSLDAASKITSLAPLKTKANILSQ